MLNVVIMIYSLFKAKLQEFELLDVFFFFLIYSTFCIAGQLFKKRYATCILLPHTTNSEFIKLFLHFN